MSRALLNAVRIYDLVKDQKAQGELSLEVINKIIAENGGAMDQVNLAQFTVKSQAGVEVPHEWIEYPICGDLSNQGTFFYVDVENLGFQQFAMLPLGYQVALVECNRVPYNVNEPKSSSVMH